jgi:hypothetical protein
VDVNVAWKLTNVSEVHTASINRVMNVTIQCYIPEDSKLHTFCRENLKSHSLSMFLGRETEFYLKMTVFWDVAPCSLRVSKKVVIFILAATRT